MANTASFSGRLPSTCSSSASGRQRFVLPRQSPAFSGQSPVVPLQRLRPQRQGRRHEKGIDLPHAMLAEAPLPTLGVRFPFVRYLSKALLSTWQEVKEECSVSAQSFSVLLHFLCQMHLKKAHVNTAWLVKQCIAVREVFASLASNSVGM